VGSDKAWSVCGGSAGDADKLLFCQGIADLPTNPLATYPSEFIVKATVMSSYTAQVSELGKVGKLGWWSGKDMQLDRGTKEYSSTGASQAAEHLHHASAGYRDGRRIGTVTNHGDLSSEDGASDPLCP
jgi:hypothetical protein